MTLLEGQVLIMTVFAECIPVYKQLSFYQEPKTGCNRIQYNAMGAE